VTLEAMASGLPCVCAGAAGSRSLVEDNVSGFLTPPDAQNFAGALRALIDAPDLRAAFGAAANEKSKDFTWESVLAALFDHYHDAIASYHAATAGSQSAKALNKGLKRAA
jgi:glycosyltransferase involved in cell wall biosynthesis